LITLRSDFVICHVGYFVHLLPQGLFTYGVCFSLNIAGLFTVLCDGMQQFIYRGDDIQLVDSSSSSDVPPGITKQLR